MTTDELVRRMVGRELSQLFPKQDAEIGDAGADGRAAHARGRVHRRLASRSARGEIVALAGLVGAGRSEVARAIFGIDTPDAGHVEVDGVQLKPRLARRRDARRASASCPRTAASRAS